MQSLQSGSKRTASNGTANVEVVDTPAAGYRRTVFAIRYTNLDDAAQTPILKKTISASTLEIKRATGIPAGASDEEWCSVNRPFVLLAGEVLIGVLAAPHSTAAGQWLAEYLQEQD